MEDVSTIIVYSRSSNSPLSRVNTCSTNNSHQRRAATNKHLMVLHVGDFGKFSLRLLIIVQMIFLFTFLSSITPLLSKVVRLAVRRSIGTKQTSEKQNPGSSKLSVPRNTAAGTTLLRRFFLICLVHLSWTAQRKCTAREFSRAFTISFSIFNLLGTTYTYTRIVDASLTNSKHEKESTRLTRSMTITRNGGTKGSNTRVSRGKSLIISHTSKKKKRNGLAAWILTPFEKLKYRFFGWKPVERIFPGLNMDYVFLYLGEPRADKPPLLQTSLDNVMIVFFRWFDETDDLSWTLQRDITKAALFREHYRYSRQCFEEVAQDLPNAEPPLGKHKNITLGVESYEHLHSIERRMRDWFFDGNTFVRRQPSSEHREQLTEADIDFMQGIPFSTLRIARGVFGHRLPAAAESLKQEVKARNIVTVDELLEYSGFVDFFVLLDVFDEMFTQIDILREYYYNWKNERLLTPVTLPPGHWPNSKDFSRLLLDNDESPAQLPKCATLKCYIQYQWAQSPPLQIDVQKKNVNSLKLLLIGNSGDGKYMRGRNQPFYKSAVTTLLDLRELEQTVRALRAWHVREKADAVLGLGEMMGMLPPTTVRDPQFDTKWYKLFVQDAGLDVPWLMTLGGQESIISPSTLIRHHYTLQHPNWHMPNDMYSTVFRFQADLAAADGSLEKDEFVVTVVNINTWYLHGGTPLMNSMQSLASKLMWISGELFKAVARNSTWIIVMGCHPIVSTGPQGEQARLQFHDDLLQTGHARGSEGLIMDLLFHYHVDAYVSGHDYIMEYNSLEDLSKNTTISFINSGATARLLDRVVGRGWLGRLRGAMYPVLCFSSRKIFFGLDPGGCTPSKIDRELPYKWFAPRYGSFKFHLGERVTTATGFAGMQLTKDHMILEFINGKTHKPTGKRIQRRSNKAVRDVTFADPKSKGLKMFEEVKHTRNEFARLNLSLLRKEIYFVSRCPLLAERLSLYVREVNDMVDRYEKVTREKAAFQKMTLEQQDEAAFRGLDVNQEIASAVSELHNIYRYYRLLRRKYQTLVALKDSLPEVENPQHRELLDKEKQFFNLKRLSLDIARKLDAFAPKAPQEKYKKILTEITNVSAEMKQIEKNMQAPPYTPVAETLPKADEAVDDAIVLPQKEADSRKETGALVKGLKPPTKTLFRPETSAGQVKESLGPAERWQLSKRLQDARSKFDLIKEILSFESKARAADDNKLEEAQDTDQKFREELSALQREMQELQISLGKEKLTSLQRQYLTKRAKLAKIAHIAAQRIRLHPNDVALQQVQDALKEAEDLKKGLKTELKHLNEKVKEELHAEEAEWRREAQCKQKENCPNSRMREDDREINSSEGLKPLVHARRLALDEKGETDSGEPYMKPTMKTVLGKAYASRHKTMVADTETEPKDPKSGDPSVSALSRKKAGEGKGETYAEGTVVEKEEVRESEIKAAENAASMSQTTTSESDAGVSGKSGNARGSAADEFRKSTATSSTGETFTNSTEETSETSNSESEEDAGKEPILSKIDTGPPDMCDVQPMLNVLVQRALHPETKERLDEACKALFAKRALAEQFKSVRPSDLVSRGREAWGTQAHPVPSVHVSRAWRLSFQTSRKFFFKYLMRELKAGLKFIHTTFLPDTTEEALERDSATETRSRSSRSDKAFSEEQQASLTENDEFEESTATQAVDTQTERAMSSDPKK